MQSAINSLNDGGVWFCQCCPGFVYCWWSDAHRWQKVLLAIGGVCTVAATTISGVHLINHCWKDRQSPFKTCTVTIILMVPFYSINACFCVFDSTSKYNIPALLDFIREFYEASVVVAFMQLVLNCLMGPDQVAADFAKHMQKPEHPFCLRIIPTFFKPGLSFITQILQGILQFALVMVGVTVLHIAIWIYTQYVHIEETTLKKALMIPKSVKAASCGYAMYSLTVFYFEVTRNCELRKNFERINPELKFLCIKGVIMFTVLQTFACDGLARLGFFDGLTLKGPGQTEGTPDQISEVIKNFLICLEMPLFSLLHCKAYPAGEFNEGNLDGSVGWMDLFRDLMKLSKKARRQRSFVEELRSRSVRTNKLAKAFRAFDIQGTGTISTEEFAYVLECAQWRHEEIKDLFETVDADQDGMITFDEFKAAFEYHSDDDSNGSSSGGEFGFL